MKVMQLNIWGGRFGKGIIDLVNREKPDIICFQEAMEFQGGRSFLFDDIDSIIKSTGYKHHHFVPHLGYSLMRRTANMGLAILSKLPIIKTDSVFIRLEYTDNFDLLDSDYNVQSLQRATVQCDSGPLHVLNYHRYHDHNNKNGNEETIRQCNFIADYVRNLSGSVILCGDFNLAPISDSIAIIETVLHNHITNSGYQTTRTNLTKKDEVCDYIFSTPDLIANSFEVLNDVVSDHRALTLELFHNY